MDENYAKVTLKIEGEFEIAPIHLHHLHGNITKLFEIISEIERNGGNRRNLEISMDLEYKPVREKP